MTARILVGDCREQLATLDDKSVHCCVTSPPYYGLRDYGTDVWTGGDADCPHGTSHWDGPKQTQGGQSGHASSSDRLSRSVCLCGAIRERKQIGLEPTLAEYIATLVDVFRSVRRVLRDDGTLWLNIGDSYCSTAPGTMGDPLRRAGIFAGVKEETAGARRKYRPETPLGMKPKDLMMVPARLAIALQDDGWYLRSDIIWAKPNPMPESVTDRPTASHEHIFLLTKSSRYWYDADAVRLPLSDASIARLSQDVDAQDGSDRANGGAKTNGSMKAVVKIDKQRGHGRRHDGFNDRWDAMTRDEQQANGANLRNVWTIATKPFSEAHFATFPPDIPRRCIKAGCPVGGTVLDPFLGSGTTLMVADQLDRHGIGVELNPTYAEMARKRITNDAPLFANVI